MVDLSEHVESCFWKKLDMVVTYAEGLSLITSYDSRSRDKLKHPHYHVGYGHQNWQDDDVPLEDPIHLSHMSF